MVSGEVGRHVWYGEVGRKCLRGVGTVVVVTVLVVVLLVVVLVRVLVFVLVLVNVATCSPIKYIGDERVP
jgi:hypothetical protein